MRKAAYATLLGLASLALPFSPRIRAQKPPTLPSRVRISPGVLGGMVISKPTPVYPADALQADVQGTVILEVVISRAGTVETVKAVSGPAPLFRAAIDAVRTWKYKPYLLDGTPVEVVSTVSVVFALSRRVPPPPPPTKSLAWYRKAAAQGNAVAERWLGYFYWSGQGVARDYAQSLSWFKKAANQGDAVAQNNLGNMYWHGQGVPQDYTQALAWYRKAADQGYADAQNNLGNMYWHGQGVPKDYAQAIAWYRKAADQGYADAQGNLGFMYQHGQGVPQDYAQALAWYRKAANQGDSLAEDSLGDFYKNGWNVAQS